ncbi:hypothetical protein [Cronobacter sakazakii]|uniref:hypothetical protein n=1 Tax=Cronobacter sakazakii TaxID=28141 RepID=UPI001F174533|nr:hypothetical protein [Cronobacter sakazakii]
MNKTSPIDRLISATRLNDTVRANPELYETTILRLKSIAEQLGLPLDVKVVYSSSRRVEHITISGMVWLIYDQYLGQTMNMLNRLFIEAEDAHPSLVYFHKVLAERLVDAGQLANALHCAAAYHSSREVLRSRSSDYTWLAQRVNENPRAILALSRVRASYFFKSCAHAGYTRACAIPYSASGSGNAKTA